MSENQIEKEHGRYDRILLSTLYLLGIIHWVFFFFFVCPEGGDKNLLHIVSSPAQWFRYEVITNGDWFHDMNYMGVMKEALGTFQMPYHVANLDQMNSVESRFLGTTTYITSPQIFLLYFMSPFTFSFLNLLFMYSIGFLCCLYFRRYFQLGIIPFVFLYLIFYYNGYFVSKFVAYGSWELGYYLMPLVVLLIFRAGNLKPADRKQQLRIGILLGLVIGAIVHQGSLSLLIHIMTFLAFWLIWNYRLWLFSLTAIIASFSLSFARLLPLTISRGPGANSQLFEWGGYRDIEHMVNGFVNLRKCFESAGNYSHKTILETGWHEYSVYIGLPAFLVIAYYALWAPFLKVGWLTFKNWSSLLFPCAMIVFCSIRQWKRLVIPDWVPLLNGEGLTSRFMIIPLLITLFIAAINLQGFIIKYWDRKRVRYFMVSFMVIIAMFLLNHSREWRMHSVQAKFESYKETIASDIIRNDLTFEEYYEDHYKLTLPIVKKSSDTIYIVFVWFGIVANCVALFFCCWWLWNGYNRRKQIPTWDSGT